MLDTQTSSPLLQRARGGARVALSVRGGRTRLAGLRQAGAGKAFLPRVTGVPEVVFLNTAGGLTGGDVLDVALTLGPGARAMATTQTAERAYAAVPGAPSAQMRVRLSAEAGADLAWLPQETILFDKASLERQTEIALTGDATLLMCETLVLGRAAMGERVETLWLHDRRHVTRDGRPFLTDAVALSGPVLADRTAGAGLAGARAMAMLALVAQGAEDAAGPLRTLVDTLTDDLGARVSARAGVSGWDGRTIVRLVAGDAWPLKVALARLIRHLRAESGGDLPRVWQI